LGKCKKYITLFTVILTLFWIFSPVYAIQNPDETASNLIKKGLHPLLITGLISMLPIFELRGAIPVGIAFLKQKPVLVYFIAVVFNLLPVIPILYLLLPIRYLLIKWGLLKHFFYFLDNRAKKNNKIVERYGELGLTIFVAIPLPITGAWTGALIAVFMGLSPIKSFLFITFGVFSAGIIVTVITIVGMKSLILIIPLITGFILFLLYRYLQDRGEKKGG